MEDILKTLVIQNQSMRPKKVWVTEDDCLTPLFRFPYLYCQQEAMAVQDFNIYSNYFFYLH